MPPDTFLVRSSSFRAAPRPQQQRLSDSRSSSRSSTQGHFLHQVPYLPGTCSYREVACPYPLQSARGYEYRQINSGTNSAQLKLKMHVVLSQMSVYYWYDSSIFEFSNRVKSIIPEQIFPRTELTLTSWEYPMRRHSRY